MNANERKTLKSRNLLGLFVELDASQVHPNDPGRGCPAVVYRGGCSATFCCAINEAELIGDDGDIEPLDVADLAWLESIEADVYAFIEKHTENKLAALPASR